MVWLQFEGKLYASRSSTGVQYRMGTVDVLPSHFASKQGERRFHAYGLIRELRGEHDEWFVKYSHALTKSSIDKIEQPVPIKSGLECCANDSISFHYTEGPEARFLHQYLTNSKFRVETDKDVSKWPGDANGYSRQPHRNEDAIFELLEKMSSEK